MLDSMHAAKKQESKLEFVTLDKENNIVQQSAGLAKSTGS